MRWPSAAGVSATARAAARKFRRRAASAKQRNESRAGRGRADCIRLLYINVNILSIDFTPRRRHNESMMFDQLLRRPITKDQLAATRREFLRRAALAAAAIGPLSALACGEETRGGNPVAEP